MRIQVFANTHQRVNYAKPIRWRFETLPGRGATTIRLWWIGPVFVLLTPRKAQR